MCGQGRHSMEGGTSGVLFRKRTRPPFILVELASPAAFPAGEPRAPPIEVSTVDEKIVRDAARGPEGGP